MRNTIFAQPSPGFGKSLAVFVTAFVLVFGPCLPAAPFMGVGVMPAWADVTISSAINTRQNVTGNLTITTGGSLTVSNTNTTEGGAVYATGNVVVEGTDTVNLTGNSATTGGAIYAGGNVTLSGTGTNTFNNNNASVNGGVIYTKNSTVTLSGNGTNTFKGNVASTGGGAIYTENSTVTISDGSNNFTHNIANNYSGGAIFATGGVTISGGNNTFEGNTATDGGGAISARGGVTISGGSNNFTHNIASNYSGGAIYAVGNVTISGGNNTFENNTAASNGGAIYAENGNIILTPDSGNSIVFNTATDTIATDNSSAWVHIGGAGTTDFNAGFNHPNITVVHFGTNNYATASGWANNSSMTVNQNNTAFSTVSSGWKSTTGSGRATPYSTVIGDFHLNDNQTLSLDMNVANNTNVPYFTATGNVTTGLSTTLYGVIDSGLSAALASSNYTYAVFNTTGNGTGFTPANYRTNNALIELANPTFYANGTGGTFTVEVQRTGSTPSPSPGPSPSPDPDPVPPVPPVSPTPEPPTPEVKPVITGDFMGLFSKNSLKADMERILYYDYFYNGGTIANPGPGTLIGSNAFMDALMLVLPSGQDAFTPGQRLLALESAVSMTDMSGSIDMLHDTGSRLRGQVFATDAMRNTRATMKKTNDAATVNLWATPTYSHETGKNRGQYGGLDAGYRYNLYGGVVGADVLFADDKFRVGGVFTVGRGSLDSKGDGLKTKNDADYVGGALFGAWLPAPDWEIGIYTGYIGQKNDVSQDNILHLESKFDTSLWQVGVNAKYETSLGNDGKRKLSVGAGVDAQLYKRDSHSISANGKDIANMGKSDLNQVQIPLTVGLQDTFDFENGSSLTLDGRIGYRLTLGDLATKSDWSIPSGTHTARVTGPDADRSTGMVGVSALWRKDQLSLGAGYDIELGAKRTNHQLSGQVRWEF